MERQATEAPDSVARVFYDGECPRCVGAVRRFEHVLGRRQVELTPLQAPGTSAELGVPEARLLEEMRMRLPDGTVLGGAAAVMELARRIWWAWPLWVLSRLPGAMGPMEATYRLIARHRHSASRAVGPGPKPVR